MSPNKDSELSIVVVGDSQCGKTQLINKFQNFNFSKVKDDFHKNHKDLVENL